MHHLYDIRSLIAFPRSSQTDRGTNSGKRMSYSGLNQGPADGWGEGSVRVDVVLHQFVGDLCAVCGRWGMNEMYRESILMYV